MKELVRYTEIIVAPQDEGWVVKARLQTAYGDKLEYSEFAITYADAYLKGAGWLERKTGIKRDG